jgi:DNA phosphorothioation-dependent restriction protein DptG
VLRICFSSARTYGVFTLDLLNPDSYGIISQYKQRAMKLENIYLGRPHDACSIYFILEKERIANELSAKGSSVKKADEHQQQLSFDLAGYDFLSLPDPPTQYRNLQLPHGWFVRGKDCQPNACEDDNRRLVGFFSSPLFCYLIRC